MSNYFVCTYGNFDSREDIIELSFSKKCYQLHIEANYPSAMDFIQANDMLFLKDNCYIIAYGAATGPKEYCDNNGWNHIVRVSEWIKLPTPIHSYGIRWNTICGGSMSLVKQVKPEWAEEKIQNSIATNGCGVSICNITLDELLTRNLYIPDYQRGYCWRIRNVRDLLDDIIKQQKSYVDEDYCYHLGTVILHENAEKKLMIIDGQQRLITLAMWQYLRSKSANEKEIPLLKTSLKINNLTHTVQQAVLRTRDAINGYEDIGGNFKSI